MPSVQRFLIHNGDRPGRAIDLVTFPFTIGRARECDRAGCGRLAPHAQLSSDHLNLYLEDLGSTNGTYVNGQRIAPGQPHRLRAGDVIHFGQSFSVVFDDPVTTVQIDPVQIPPPGLEINVEAATVTVGGQVLDPPLSPNQFTLLTLLVDAGRIVTQANRRHDLGPDDRPDQTPTLVSRLRSACEADPRTSIW